jgi:hypothetical protein
VAYLLHARSCWATETLKHARNNKITDWIKALLGDSSVNAWIAQQCVRVTWPLRFLLVAPLSCGLVPLQWSLSNCYIHRAGYREVSSRDFPGFAKNQELDLVEGSTASKTGVEPADTAGAGNVEAPAPTAREWGGGGRGERERTLDEDNEPGLTETYQGAARDERP